MSWDFSGLNLQFSPYLNCWIHGLATRSFEVLTWPMAPTIGRVFCSVYCIITPYLTNGTHRLAGWPSHNLAEKRDCIIQKSQSLNNVGPAVGWFCLKYAWDMPWNTFWCVPLSSIVLVIDCGCLLSLLLNQQKPLHQDQAPGNKKTVNTKQMVSK
jgi:hypothetical protein